MTILYILAAAIIAYCIGYQRGHAAALAVPYAMLAGKMEELCILVENRNRKKSDEKNDTTTTP